MNAIAIVIQRDNRNVKERLAQETIPLRQCKTKIYRLHFKTKYYISSIRSHANNMDKDKTLNLKQAADVSKSKMETLSIEGLKA